MPHVTIKLYAGRSEETKAKLAEALCRAVTTTLNCGEDAVSVGVEDVTPSDWTEKVYQREIAGNKTIYKQPGYNPLK